MCIVPDNAADECHRCSPGSYPGQADAPAASISALISAPHSERHLCICAPCAQSKFSGHKSKRSTVEPDAMESEQK